MDFLVKVILAIVPVLLSVFVVPWMKTHTTAAQQEGLSKVIDTLVQTAEQLFGPGTGSQKMEAVTKWLDEKGVSVSSGDIEAAVLRLHASGRDWVTAHQTDTHTTKSTNLPAPALLAAQARLAAQQKAAAEQTASNAAPINPETVNTDYDVSLDGDETELSEETEDMITDADEGNG